MQYYKIHAGGMVSLLLAITGVLAAAFSISACGAHPMDKAATVRRVEQPAVLYGLPSLDRLASGAGDFMPKQDGADYAADLASNLVTPVGSTVILSPQYTEAQEPISEAAYCIYRLELDPAAAGAKLTITWNGTAPDADKCWLGLPCWQRGVWEWRQCTGSEIAVDDPGRYATGEKHCYIAVVLLGATPAELDSIGFGENPALPGYTLFQPLKSATAYLIDEAGTVVRSWPGVYLSGAMTVLDGEGRLWRQVALDNAGFQLGGRGGRLEVMDWDNNLLWDYELSTGKQCTHHDFELLPNGNILLTVWNKYSEDEAIAIGRDPDLVGVSGLYIDSIIEIETMVDDPAIVWQWRASDHLVQDVDDTKLNYGDPAAHPELVDINFVTGQGVDWTHINAVAYNAELDQIVLSVHGVSELWIIDHSTTTEEAAGHSGGKYGRGGDLLYRWGNPVGYGAGDSSNRTLFGQHDVHWIEPGLEGAGNLLLFNNLAGTPEGKQYSAIQQFVTPQNEDGSYYMEGGSFGPTAPVWEYIADPPESLYSPSISSAQRLQNGNTLICNGDHGQFIEVTPGGEVVWEYVNPFPTSGAQVFRALRYEADYPGLAALQ